MATTGAVIARIISQYSDKGTKAAQKDIAKLGKKIDAFGKKAFKSFGLATTAAAALAIKIGKDAVQGAMEDEKQQASLALALKNTTGATQSAIEANSKYLDSLELQVAIDNNQLIPALQKLALATGNLSKAQELLELSTDVAALAGVDLATASTAIARAQSGQTSSLKRLNLGLDKTILASGDFVKIQKELTKLSKGQAAAAAQTFAGRMETLRLKFAQITDKLGYALIPVLEKLVVKISTEVIPALERFIRLNQKEIVDAFEGTVAIIERTAKALIGLAGILKRFEPIFTILGSGILALIGYLKLLAGLKTVGAIIAGLGAGVKRVQEDLVGLGSTIDGVGAATKRVDENLIIFGVNTAKLGANLKGFKSVVGPFNKLKFVINGIKMAMSGAALVAAKLMIVLLAAFAVYKLIKVLQEAAAKRSRKQDAEKRIALEKERMAAERLAATYDSAAVRAQKAYEKQKSQQDIILAGFKPIEKAVKEANKQAQIDARYRAMEQADLEKQRILQEQINKLKKFGVTATSEQNPIELAAAAKLLEKQGVIAKQEIKKLERLMEENLLLKARETLALRYADIQKALADQKLDTKEIEELSKKWGISGAAVAAYIHIVKSVEDQEISPDEIQALADLWNTSTGNAEKFLHTYMRIQDGLLSSNEVFDLIKMGFFKTEEEARKYADYVAVVHDGLVDDKEFEKLKIKWNDSTAKVTAYFTSMGVKFDYNGELISPVDRLKTSWENAGKALQDFLDKLNSAKGFDYNKFNPSGTPSTTASTTTASTTEAATVVTAAAEKAADAAKTYAETLNKFITKEHKENAEAKAVADAQVKVESGAITAAILAAQMASAEAAARALSSGQIKQADMAISPVSSSDYDERFRFRAMQGVMSSGSGGFQNSMAGGTTVNLTVNGSVSTEQDLVTAIRTGLLGAQYNGSQITLQAI